MKNAGLPKLEIDEFAGGMQLTFLNKKTDEPKNELKNELKNSQEKRFKLLLELINSNNQVSIPELSIQTNSSQTTVKRDIQLLKERNVIKRVGPLRGGHWEIAK
jgi:predicted HTH transcriptional regulator